MNRSINLRLSTAIIAAFLLPACQSGSDDASGSTEQPASATTAAVQKPAAAQASGSPVSSVSPGKITAPISIDYSIVGNPVVGQPLSINLQFASSLNDRPITVHYRVNEAGSMTFPESQVETVALLPLADATLRSQQVTVVPQREGRLYLVVSAEIETDGGTMIRSMSIPIQVGRVPRESTLNGEWVEGPDGEVGISMPAKKP